MKKKHFILSSLLLCSVIVFGQGKSKQHINILPDEAALSNRVKKIDPDFLKASRLNAKAVGDTLYYRYFQDSIPTGWSIVNNNPNNFQWTWDTIYKNGQYSSPTDIITSTSASNGFLLLPGDFYNTPMSMGVAMNTYIESDSINLTNNGVQPNGFCNIWVRYQQALRHCCSGATRIVLQVSSDNFITFQEYDATNALPVNATNGTITNTINISIAAAFTPNIKIRFLSEGNTHYYWMIDDFTVIEGPENDLELREPRVEFNTTYTYNPFYTQIPYDLFTLSEYLA